MHFKKKEGDYYLSIAYQDSGWNEVLWDSSHDTSLVLGYS